MQTLVWIPHNYIVLWYYWGSLSRIGAKLVHSMPEASQRTARLWIQGFPCAASNCRFSIVRATTSCSAYLLRWITWHSGSRQAGNKQAGRQQQQQQQALCWHGAHLIDHFQERNRRQSMPLECERASDVVLVDTRGTNSLLMMYCTLYLLGWKISSPIGSTGKIWNQDIRH